ncbi:MAG: hypothetical protein ACE5EM_09290 [Sphingomonadales bacterium]
MGRKRTEIIDFKEAVGLVIFLTRRKKNLSLAQLAALSGIPARQLNIRGQYIVFLRFVTKKQENYILSPDICPRILEAVRRLFRRCFMGRPDL